MTDATSSVPPTPRPGEIAAREPALAHLMPGWFATVLGGAGLVGALAAQGLRRLGTRPPGGASRAAAGTGLETLTEREREIADLVAQGRANKEVAAELFLSEKTIEHHLSRIYAKAGVRSRTELAAMLGGGRG